VLGIASCEQICVVKGSRGEAFFSGARDREVCYDSVGCDSVDTRRGRAAHRGGGGDTGRTPGETPLALAMPLAMHPATPATRPPESPLIRLPLLRGLLPRSEVRHPQPAGGGGCSPSWGTQGIHPPTSTRNRRCEACTARVVLQRFFKQMSCQELFCRWQELFCRWQEL
jgi:hypothetical protein